MPTHAELSSKLLRDAAVFFRNLGTQNQPLAAQMEKNATVFDQMAMVILQDPQGISKGHSNAELTARLLKDGAKFFRSLSEQNETIREQMIENAKVYEQLGDLVMKDPLGVLD